MTEFPAFRYGRGAAEGGGRNGHLVERDVVHEHVVGPVAVEELHLALVDHRLLDALVGAERALDDRLVPQVPELGAHEGAALAGLHVLELDHLEQPVGEVERHPVLQVVRRQGHQSV